MQGNLGTGFSGERLEASTEICALSTLYSLFFRMVHSEHYERAASNSGYIRHPIYSPSAGSTF